MFRTPENSSAFGPAPAISLVLERGRREGFKGLYVLAGLPSMNDKYSAL